jgi:hypothetical protein
MTMTAKKIFPCTIKHRYPLPAMGTPKPYPFTAIVAWRPGESDCLLDVFPLAPLWPKPITENHAVVFYLKTNAAGLFITNGPRDYPHHRAGLKIPLFFQPSDVNPVLTLRCGLCPS